MAELYGGKVNGPVEVLEVSFAIDDNAHDRHQLARYLFDSEQ